MNEGKTHTQYISCNDPDTIILTARLSNIDRLVELNRQIESMTKELANRKDEADDAMKRWEEKIAAAEEEKSLLRKNLEK